MSVWEWEWAFTDGFLDAKVLEHFASLEKKLSMQYMIDEEEFLC